MFGTAGVPLAAKGRGPVAGVEALAALGLDAMEIEFVRGVWMDERQAKELRAKARKLKIHLTAHAPYWLNLNSKDARVVAATKWRIIEAAAAADAAGARYLAVHAAFYSGDTPDRAYANVKRRIQGVLAQMKKLGLRIALAPELMGRPSQFGSLEEILSLCAELPQLVPCIDFAHHHARTGSSNTYVEFSAALNLVRRTSGPGALRRLHIHVAGIEYGASGEKRHLNLRESDMNYKGLLEALRDNGAQGIVICESPNLEEDALLLKRTYSRLTR